MTERRVPDAELQGWVGRNISLVCDHGYISEVGWHHPNHCAHFVAHLLNLSFGVTCGDLTNDPHQGATLRVNEIYNRCTDRGSWSMMPSPLIYSLIFATQSTNMLQSGNMGDHRHKHMGIWSDPYVYNYSTDARMVLQELVPDFQARLDGVYNPSGTNPVRLFYGRNLP